MYEVNQSTLENSLETANPTVFTESTVDLILNLAAPTTTEQATVQQVAVDSTGQVTVPAGTDIAMLDIADSGRTTLDVPDDLPVIVFESATGAVQVEFNANVVDNDAAIDRVVVGAGGSDIITVKDALDSYIDGGSGNDSIVTATGDDSIIGGAGNDSITAGAGDDTVVAGVGNDTVEGGEGFDVVVATGKVTDYTVTVSSTGDLILTKADGTKIETEDVQYVQLDNGTAVIGAANNTQAEIAVLYETLFGRTADAGGLDYWLDQATSGKANTNIADLFVSIGGSTFANLTNEQFVELLYQNTFNRAGDADGRAYWLAQLSSGQSRGTLAATFADIAVDNFNNSLVDTVGYVKIIDGLI